MKRDTLIKTHVVKQLSQLMGTENMQRLTLQRSVTILWYKKRDIANLLIRQYKREHVAFMAADASWEKAGDALVAPHFSEVEEMVGDG